MVLQFNSLGLDHLSTLVVGTPFLDERHIENVAFLVYVVNPIPMKAFSKPCRQQALSSISKSSTAILFDLYRPSLLGD